MPRRSARTATSDRRRRTLGASGVAVLDQIDQQLDGLLENWTKTLLDNLDDPTAKKSIKLLPEAQKASGRCVPQEQETAGEDQQRSRAGDADRRCRDWSPSP